MTGANGYIGSFLIERLVKAHKDVRLFVRSPNRSSLAGTYPNLEVFEGDILNPADLAEAMADVNIVFHLAGRGSPVSPVESDADLLQVNVTGTLHVLNAAVEAGVRRVVYASSAAVYGDSTDNPKRESMTLMPSSTYAVSKIGAEHLCSMIHRRGTVETVVLRLFNVYGPRQTGPGQDDKLVPRVIRSIQTGDAITLRGDGEQTRDFVYIDDVVDAFVRAGNVAGAAGTIINVGTGQPVSIKSVVAMIANTLGVSPKIGREPAIDGEVMAATADVTLCDSVLGWSPGISMADGIAATTQRILHMTARSEA